MERRKGRRNAVIFGEVVFDGMVKTKSLWGKWQNKRWEILTDGCAKIWKSDGSLKRVINLKETKMIDTKLIDNCVKFDLKQPVIVKVKDTNIYEVFMKFVNTVNNSLDLNGFSTAAVTTNNAGNITGINSLFQEMFGYTEDECLGKNCKMLMPPFIAEEHDNYLKRYQKTREKLVF